VTRADKPKEIAAWLRFAANTRRLLVKDGRVPIKRLVWGDPKPAWPFLTTENQAVRAG
jgi:hypothetical protein